MSITQRAGAVGGDRVPSPPLPAADAATDDGRTRLVTVRPPAVTGFRPGHTDGDGDFDGHGPFVHLVAQVRRLGSVMLLEVSAFFQETGGDWTTFEGALAEPFLDVAKAYPGWRIQAIRGETYQSVQLVLNGFGRHHFQYGDAGLVRAMVLRGDSDGGVFGGLDRPEILSMQFNEVQLELVRARPAGDPR